MRAATGILVHGRHLQAIGWEQMVWGDAAAGKLGTLPTAVLAMLNNGVRDVTLIVFGTGVSRDTDGNFESEVMKQLLISRFDELEQFAVIKNHSLWFEQKELIRELVSNIVADTDSQNTKEEIALATERFTQRGITNVIEVTGASHGPRCAQLQAMARADGIIPGSQFWQLVTDDVPYAGTSVGDTTVVEEPHRKDDPALHIPSEIRPAKLFSQYYTVSQEQREPFLRGVAKLLRKYR